MKKNIIAFLLSFFIASCSVPKHLRKTDVADSLYNFSQYSSFDSYVKNYRHQMRVIRPTLTEKEVDRIAPFTKINTNINCPNRKGFVLIHGLTDSPFSMNDLSISILKHDPCAVINMPILPGHALVPGALLEINQKDWITAVKFSIEDLQKYNVNSISLIGFSTGGALSLNYVLKNKDFIDKLVLITPSLDLGVDWYEWIAIKTLDTVGYINNNLAYVTDVKEYSPYRYTNMSANSIYALYKLINENNEMLEKINKFNTPIFLALSTDDNIINPASTIKILQDNKFAHLTGIIYTKDIIRVYDKLLKIPAQNLPKKIVSLSHSAIHNSPANDVFGKNALINYGCIHYDLTSELFKQCKNRDKDFYFGETTKENLEQYPKLSRIFYNPYYDSFSQRILSFLYDTQYTSNPEEYCNLS